MSGYGGEDALKDAFHRVHDAWVRRVKARPGTQLTPSEAAMFERLVDRMTDEASVLATEWECREAEHSLGASAHHDGDPVDETDVSNLQHSSFRSPGAAVGLPPGFECMVYRGLNGGMLHESYLRNMTPGVAFTDPAFVSASGRDVFDNSIMVQIRSKTSRWIAPISALEGTDEFLFISGTRFRVMERTDDEFTGKTYITLDEIG